MTTPLPSLVTFLLPTPARTAMLRACLDDDGAAWQRWRDEFGGAREVLAGERDGVKRLLPMLAAAQRRTGAAEDPAVLTCLRTAYLREEFRSRTFQAICHRAFSALDRHDVPFIVLRGAALAETDYADPALRHCHDCDVMVTAGEHDAAVKAICDGDFTVFRDTRAAGARHTILVHDTGLPVQVHNGIFDLPSHPTPVASILDRARRARICGADCRILCPADGLLHVCAHAAFTARRENLVWACDAMTILAAHPELDWDVLERTVESAGVALPVGVLLDYLARGLAAPIPGPTLERIAALASAATPLACEATIFGIAASPQTGASDLWAAASGRERRQLLRWMLRPAPIHMRWAYGLAEDRPLWPAYLLRPFHGLLRRFRWYRRRAGRELPPLPDFMVEPAAPAPSREAA